MHKMVPKFAWKNGFKWNGCFWVLVSWSHTYLSECFCGVWGDGPKLRWLIGDYTEFFEDCQLGNANAGNKRFKLFSSCHYPWNRARRHYFHWALDRYYFWYWYTFIQSQAEVWLKIWDMEESWIKKAWLLNFCLFCLTSLTIYPCWLEAYPVQKIGLDLTEILLLHHIQWWD